MFPNSGPVWAQQRPAEDSALVLADGEHGTSVGSDPRQPWLSVFSPDGSGARASEASPLLCVPGALVRSKVGPLWRLWGPFGNWPLGRECFCQERIRCRGAASKPMQDGPPCPFPGPQPMGQGAPKVTPPSPKTAMSLRGCECFFAVGRRLHSSAGGLVVESEAPAPSVHGWLCGHRAGWWREKGEVREAPGAEMREWDRVWGGHRKKGKRTGARLLSLHLGCSRGCWSCQQISFLLESLPVSFGAHHQMDPSSFHP